MNDMRDSLDDLIGRALNDPLGEESPLAWNDLVAPQPVHPTDRGSGRRRSRRRSWALRGALLAALCLAAAASTLLVLPGRSPSLLENAAAAIQGDGPVLHLVFEASPAQVERLDVRTGRIRTEAVSTSDEVWYDRERRVFKRIVDWPQFSDVWWRSPTEAFSATYGKQPLSAAASQDGPVSIEVPPVVTLFSRYKEALAAGEVQYDGEGTLDGRRVVFILFSKCELMPFPGHPGSSLGCAGVINQKIALDKDSYLPVAVYPNGDGPGGPHRIRTVELIGRDAANLSKPAASPLRPALVSQRADCRCLAVAARQSRTIAQAAARPWLGRTPVALAPSLAGRPLNVTRAELLNPPGAARRHGLELVYGSSCDGKPRYKSGYVLVQQARTPEILYQTQSPLVTPSAAASVPLFQTSNRFEECAAPNWNAYTGSDRLERLWLTAFYRNGLYVSVSSPKRALTVRATREILRGR